MATCKWGSKTGAGLTDKDWSRNLTTMAAKLKDLCPCYTQMEIIYAGRANVTPWKLYSSLQDADDGNHDADGNSDESDPLVNYDESD